MDNLTHTLTGALIGQAGLKRKTGLAMPALLIGANIPDVDVSCFLWTEGLEHLAIRRGITHGPPAMVLLPLALAGLLWGFDRWQTRRGTRPEGRLPVRFGWLYALAFIACLSHPALDWLNVYGVRLLEPFSSQWFYGDTLFIIDVWLWLGMGLATWLSLRREKRGGNWRRPARVALVGALAYIGLNWGISQLAERDALTRALMDFARDVQHSADSIEVAPDSRVAVIANPLPIKFWEREKLYGRDGEWVKVIQISYDDSFAESISPSRCAWPKLGRLQRQRPDVDAFLFWSRAPFAERAPDGSVILRDARFYDPRARAGFSIALPEVPCVELADE